MADINPYLQGFGLSASLIIAIGAQNAFILRAGLKRQFVFSLTSLCVLSDAVLIAAGCGGIGALVQAHPRLVQGVTWIGAAFLLIYGVRSLISACRGDALAANSSPAAPDYRRTLLTCLAVTWLNPHVYLDTVLLLGSIAGRYSDAQRLAFALGAISASTIWFYALGFGARKLAPLFSKPITWRLLDGLIALIMWLIAVTLLGSVI